MTVLRESWRDYITAAAWNQRAQSGEERKKIDRRRTRPLWHPGRVREIE